MAEQKFFMIEKYVIVGHPIAVWFAERVLKLKAQMRQVWFTQEQFEAMTGLSFDFGDRQDNESSLDVFRRLVKDSGADGQSPTTNEGRDSSASENPEE